MRVARVAAMLAGGLLLAACTSRADKAELAQACPRAYRVQEAATLVRFKPGTGRDPIDIEFRADLGNIEVECTFYTRRGYVDVQLKIQLVVAQGPGQGSQRANFEYAVGVIGPAGDYRQRQRFTADVAFTADRSRGALVDEVVVRLPIAPDVDPGSNRIAVALILRPEELDYNRRALGAAPR
jgi:hypothetical protein